MNFNLYNTESHQNMIKVFAKSQIERTNWASSPAGGDSCQEKRFRGMEHRADPDSGGSKNFLMTNYGEKVEREK